MPDDDSDTEAEEDAVLSPGAGAGGRTSADEHQETAAPQLTWVLEQYTIAECEERACQLSVQVRMQDMLPEELANYVQSNSVLLNAPEAYIYHQLSPIFASVVRYCRASRWHSRTDPGHHEALNFTKLLGGSSGTGKSQTQRKMLGEYARYERTTGTDSIVRNCTQESLECRMFTNAMREMQYVPGDVREGAAFVVYDEGNKLMARDQYKSGKTDGRERWMECANGELIVTDRKGGSEKVAKGRVLSSAASSSSPNSSSTTSPPSPTSSVGSPRSNENGDDKDEFFACQLTTEKFRSHMNAIIYTHPWRVARWAWDEQGADGTDGWMARLKTICIVEPRKVCAGREFLMEMADNPKKTMPVPLYHLLVCVHLICLELPVPTNGIMTHKPIEFDSDCEEEFMIWQTWAVGCINALDGAPNAELMRVLYSKSGGDLIKETAVAGLQRIALRVIKEHLSSPSPTLQDYHEYNLDVFKKAFQPHLRRLIRDAPRNAATGYPQILVKEDIVLAKARVQWEINTALLLLNRPIRTTSSSGAKAPTMQPMVLPSSHGVATGRHDLGPLRKERSDFLLPVPPASMGKKAAKPGPDTLAFYLHVVLTSPRVAPGIISAAMLSQLKGSPRIALDTGTHTVKLLAAELEQRGLAKLISETATAEDLKLCSSSHAIKVGNKRFFIQVEDLSKLQDPSRIASVKAQLSHFGLTVANIILMNKEVVPPAEHSKYLRLAELKVLATRSDIGRGDRPAGLAGAAEEAPVELGSPAATRRPAAGELDSPAAHSVHAPNAMELASQMAMTDDDYAMMPGGSQPAQNRAPQVPPGWQVLLDPNSGAWYYNNLQTGESHWMSDGFPPSTSVDTLTSSVYMAQTPPRLSLSASKRPISSPGLGLMRQRKGQE